ncbi:MAG: type II toxin-antitoxin system VapC family toxin [Acidobacteriota bacterium]
MATYFFDSSALTKFYHQELGSAKVQSIFSEPGRRILISRLTSVEMQSVFAGKVRTHAITLAEASKLRRAFLSDIRHRSFEVLAVTGPHYRRAERLIELHGVSQRLRTLDALQLAVALGLRQRALLDYFVASDKALCTIAATEGLPVVNAELP